jgi:hypothetical protein
LDHVDSFPRQETFNPHFDVALLKQYGYTKVRIDVAFRYKAESAIGGRLRLQAASAHNTAVLGTKEVTNIVFDTGWHDGFYSVTTGIDALNSAEGAFMLLWKQAGASTYCVGKRTVIITALQ